MRTKFSYSKIVDKGFGAIGIGGDLRALDQEDFNELYSAFLEYGFLIFPNQHLNEAENITECHSWVNQISQDIEEFKPLKVYDLII